MGAHRPIDAVPIGDGEGAQAEPLCLFDELLGMAGSF
jgi:hypothetical protein